MRKSQLLRSLWGKRRLAHAIAKPARALTRTAGLCELERRLLLTAAAGSPPWNAPVFTSLPATPSIISAPSATFGKLNSDPYADAIVDWSNGDGSTTISGMLGQSNGTFTRSDIATVTGTLLSATAADVTGDGLVDLIVYWQAAGTPSSATIDVYINNGDGTFTHKPSITGAAVNGILTVQDMNGDTHQDILVEDSTSDAIDVYLGTGAGIFTTPKHTSFGAGHSIVSLDTDLNNDSVTDIILNYTTGTFPSSNSTLEVHLGQVTGLYNTTASFTDSGNQTQFVRLDTFAGDTLPDIVATQEQPDDFSGPENLVVFHNTGSGNFAPSFTESYPNGVLSSVTGDVNGDGKPDLIVFEGNFTNESSVIVHVEIGGANATFTDGQTFTVANFLSGTLQDVDNDHSPDIVVENGSFGDSGLVGVGVSIYFNNAAGSGTFVTTPVSVAPSAAGAEFGFVGDLNGDGKLDIYFPCVTTDDSNNITDNSVSVFINTGGRTFGSEKSTDFGPNTSFNFLFDYNGDHNADALVFQDVTPTNTGNVADAFSFYAGNSNGTFTAPAGQVTFPATVLPDLSITDFDSDGDLDLVLPGVAVPGLYVVTQIGGTAPSPVIAVTDPAGTVTSGQITPVSFGSVVQNSADPSVVFTITNSGAAPLTIGTISFLDGGSSKYSVTADTIVSPLAIGASGTITVDLSAAAVGTFTDTLSIVNGDSTLSPFLIPLTGTITAPVGTPAISVTANSLPVTSGQLTPIGFGSVVQNAADPTVTFTVTNSGTAPLSIGALGFINTSSYSVTGDTIVTPLAPNASGTITISLSTAAQGTFTGSFSIANGSNITPFLIPLTGTITGPGGNTTTVLMPGGKFTYHDANNAAVTVIYAGKAGTATITRAEANNLPGDILSIAIAGSTTASSLTITSAGGNGLTAVGAITDDSPLNAITAKTTDITGAGVTFTGSGLVNTLSLHDLAAGATIAEPGNSGVKPVVITLDSVGAGATITSGSGLTLTVGDWSAGGSVTAPWIATLKTIGDKTRSLPGNFSADLNLSGVGAPKGLALGSATILGSITAGTWTIDAATGAIAANATAAPWQTDITGAVAGLTTKASAAGTLEAASLAKLTVGTDSALNLTLTGVGVAAGKTTLGAEAVKGNITAGTYDITGGTGAISANSIGSAFQSDITGNVASITTKLSASGNFWAGSITTFKVGGSLTDAIIDLTLAGNTGLPKVMTLGSLTVAGTLSDTTITAPGYVGTVTLGAMSNSDFYIGTRAGLTGFPATGSDFTFQPPTPDLASFTVKGITANVPSFSASIVDAENIGKVSLKLIDAGSEPNPYGFGLGVASSISFSALGVSGGKPITLKNLTQTSDLTNPTHNPSGVTLPIGAFTVLIF